MPVEVGDDAPRFTLPMARGRAYNDVEEFALADALGGGPVVLAFFPAAFTSGCTEELCAFTDGLHAFDRLDADVYGISVDLSFSHNEFIVTEEIEVPLLSDHEREVTRAYDVVLEDMYGHFEVSRRALFVLDDAGVVRHRWVREGDNPPFDRLVEDTVRAVRDVREGRI
jgi:peroxiredoxin